VSRAGYLCTSRATNGNAEITRVGVIKYFISVNLTDRFDKGRQVNLTDCGDTTKMSEFCGNPSK
jgi:hypothetical protein